MKFIKIMLNYKVKTLINSRSNNLMINAYYYKCFILLFIIFNFSTLFYYTKSKNNNKNINSKIKPHINQLIKNNFFILDSNNLDEIQSIMYGFSVSIKGILTNNYYKEIGYNEEPEPQGIYIMIRKMGEEIRINQDFSGSFGLYIYENKNTGYFALSNSFLLLEEYLVGKENFTLNKDFSDNLIISDLCTPSIYETLVNEITLIPSNSFIILNIKTKTFKIYYIDYKENSVPFESDEGLKIIDKWADKWSYIIRSLKKKTNNIISDLSGGFDTRTLLAIILNSGIDINKILINSINSTLHCFEQDFKIASNISKKYGFKLNNFALNENGTKLSIKDSILLSIYPKLGFHKEFYLKTKFYSNPIFRFTGSGGEIIRGYPLHPIKNYININCYNAKKIKGHAEEFYNSSLRIFNRSITLLKKKKTYYNDYEISADLYWKGRTRNHYGKAALESFLVNQYILQPLIDPDIKRIKFDVNEKSSHDLIAYILIRFSHDLIYFPFQGKRELNKESIKKVEKLNKNFSPYKIKLNYNENFYIDIKRNCPVPPSKDNNIEEYLRKLFKSQKFINFINQIYDNNVYNWAKEYSKKSSYYPLRHGYGLFAVVKTLENLSINKRYFTKRLIKF